MSEYVPDTPVPHSKEEAMEKRRNWLSNLIAMGNPQQAPAKSGCGGCGGCGKSAAPAAVTATREEIEKFDPTLLHDPCDDAHTGFLKKDVSRRGALKFLFGGAAATAAVASTACSTEGFLSPAKREKAVLEFQEFFKRNYRLMNEGERQATIKRLERRYEMERDIKVTISDGGPQPGVLYGYAFNISRCKGYRECIAGCVRENNQDRKSNMQYIRIFEKENGSLGLDEANADYFHEVPAAGHFYIGTQCFQCDNPPCVDVCPTGATWRERDGIVVVDYDWCIGCRYCEAACPYWARRFNWAEPEIPTEKINPIQHYLGNRLRRSGAVEKCTYCIQRTRRGVQPACVEACPTGARTFGNLLDPSSEIRKILATKKVFRLKEDLNTEPKFWYYMD